MDEEPDQPTVYRITERGIAFAVWNEDGFGRITVDLEPGQSETLMINGRLVTVIREYVQ